MVIRTPSCACTGQAGVPKTLYFVQVVANWANAIFVLLKLLPGHPGLPKAMHLGRKVRDTAQPISLSKSDPVASCAIPNGERVKQCCMLQAHLNIMSLLCICAPLRGVQLVESPPDHLILRPFSPDMVSSCCRWRWAGRCRKRSQMQRSKGSWAQRCT